MAILSINHCVFANNTQRHKHIYGAILSINHCVFANNTCSVAAAVVEVKVGEILPNRLCVFASFRNTKVARTQHIYASAAEVWDRSRATHGAFVCNDLTIRSSITVWTTPLSLCPHRAYTPDSELGSFWTRDHPFSPE